MLDQALTADQTKPGITEVVCLSENGRLAEALKL